MPKLARSLASSRQDWHELRKRYWHKYNKRKGWTKVLGSTKRLRWHPGGEHRPLLLEGSPGWMEGIS